MVAIGLLGIGSQSLAIRAFRAGEASFVAPFEYSRLLFAAALGFFLFAETPDPWSYLGAAIIVRRDTLCRAPWIAGGLVQVPPARNRTGSHPGPATPRF